jgi:hypothetical protein
MIPYRNTPKKRGGGDGNNGNDNKWCNSLGGMLVCVHHCLCETVNKYLEEEEDGETMKTNIVTPLFSCSSYFSNE